MQPSNFFWQSHNILSVSGHASWLGMDERKKYKWLIDILHGNEGGNCYVHSNFSNAAYPSLPFSHKDSCFFCANSSTENIFRHELLLPMFFFVILLKFQDFTKQETWDKPQFSGLRPTSWVWSLYSLVYHSHCFHCGPLCDLSLDILEFVYELFALILSCQCS